MKNLYLAVGVLVIGGLFVAWWQTENTTPSTVTNDDGSEVVAAATTSPSEPDTDHPSEDYDGGMVACTMDAKMCPDGSFVGRVGPDCAFAACPMVGQSADDQAVEYCDPAPKGQVVCADIYAPVCGLVQVQCFTTPCDPIPETFGNGCEACARGNVISYTEGECGK